MSGKRIWFSIMVTLFRLYLVYNANVLFDKYWYSKARTVHYTLHVRYITRSFVSLIRDHSFIELGDYVF